MLLGSVGDYALSFLRDSVLLAIGQIPPAIRHPSVNAWLILAKASYAQRLGPRRLAIHVWIEIDIVRVSREVVLRHPEANHLARLFVNPRGRMAHMGWKYKM